MPLHRKELSDVRTIGAERPNTEVAVILGVDTHLDFHVAVAVDDLGREAWATPACQRPQRGGEFWPLQVRRGRRHKQSYGALSSPAI